MFGRVHGVRVLLALVFLLIVFGIYYQRTTPVASVPVVRLNNDAIRSLTMTPEEVELLTQANVTCPVCFGRDACSELMSDVVKGRLKVERAPFKVDGSSEQTAHRVYRNGKVRFWLRPNPPDPVLMQGFEDAICRKDPRNRRKGMKCDLEAAARRSLQTTTLDVEAIKMLYKNHLVSAKRIPLTACPSWRLLEGLIRSYDENDDKTLLGDEKSELLTTLAVNPEIAVYRFGLANKLQFPFLPFFGACGRSTFIQGPVVPLTNYLDQPLEVRIQLGAEVLKMVEGFIHEDPMWLLFTQDLTMHNLVVEESGQVFLRDLSQVMLLDKDNLEGLTDGSEHLHSGASGQKNPFTCDSACFDDFYNKLVAPQSGGDDLCKKVDRFAGHMYALVCQNILLGNEGIEAGGLFHSLSKDEEGLSNIDVSMVKTLVSKCARSSDLNAREYAAVELLDILTEDEEEDADDNQDGEEDSEDDGQDEDEAEKDSEIGDEDLGEDQYEKTHDEKAVRTKDDKYDFYDADGKADKMFVHKKDMQFP